MTGFEISFFQLDNLVRNRVGFCLLNLQDDFPQLYQGIFQDHLTQSVMQVQSGQPQTELAQRKIPKDAGIIVVCNDGAKSSDVCQTLIQQGYINAYYLKDGIAGLTGLTKGADEKV
jgi:rhodanese-related sulfurtransferase